MPFKFLPNGCSWYETHKLGGCIRRGSPRPECLSEDRSPISTRLAVLVPYRGHLADLSQLCRRLPTHLALLHGVSFHINIVNQSDGRPFNRGALVNAGVRTLLSSRHKQHAFDYLAIQDADRFPAPINHSGCAVAAGTYYRFPGASPRVLNPDSFAGGVLLLRAALYQAVNGFSNQYWGWGEEDNDMFLRLRWCGLPPKHGDKIESCMAHHDCKGCRQHKERSHGTTLAAHKARMRALMSSPRPRMLQDGLATLNFTLGGMREQRCGVTTVNVMQVDLKFADDRPKLQLLRPSPASPPSSMSSSPPPSYLSALSPSSSYRFALGVGVGICLGVTFVNGLGLMTRIRLSTHRSRLPAVGIAWSPANNREMHELQRSIGHC